MLHRMERLDAHPRHYSLNRNPRLGARQNLGPLVLGDIPSTSNSWEGLFFGGHVGYAFGSSSYQTNPPGTAAAGTIDVTGRDGQFGPLYGGLQGGYNYVTASGVLLGVEADFPSLTR